MLRRYIRRLLGASWLSDSWAFGSTPPGAFITFELWQSDVAEAEDAASVDLLLLEDTGVAGAGYVHAKST